MRHCLWVNLAIGILVQQLFGTIGAYGIDRDFKKVGELLPEGFGNGHGLVVNSNVVYLGSSSGIHVVDITNKVAPRLLGFIPTSNAIDFAMHGSYVFLADYDGGLRVFDVRESTRPKLISSLALPGLASSLTIVNSNAVVACDPGLQLVDISEPANPKAIGSFAIQERVYGLAPLSPDMLVVAGHSAGLLMVDISNPKQPQLVSTSTTRDYANKVAISGKLALVGEPSGLEILDLTNPFAVQSISFVDFPAVQGIQISGTTAVLAGSTGIRALDLNEPSYPARRGAWPSKEQLQMLSVNGDYAFVNSFSGLEIIDMASAANPQSTSRIDAKGLINAINANGEFACALDDSTGIRLYKISDGADLRLLSTYSTDGVPLGLEVSGTNIYFADSREGLLVFEIGAEGELRKVGGYNCGRSYSVFLNRDKAYIAAFTNGLQIIDVGDPKNPQPVRSFKTKGSALGVTVHGDYAYVAEGAFGFQIVDIHNPAYPLLVGASTNEIALKLVVDGDFAFSASGSQGLNVFDISIPSKPTQIARYGTNGSLRDVALRGGYAYLAVLGSGVEVIDISDPFHLRRSGGNTSFDASKIWATESAVYVAAGSDGLVTLRTYSPLFLMVSPGPGNLAKLRVTGPPGVPAFLESSLSLNEWNPAGELTLQTKPVEILLNPDGREIQFYRAGTR